MSSIPARDLRNDVSGVLRRVEAGERLTVTVSGRPVADLVPLPDRVRTMSWDRFSATVGTARADAGLAAELRDLLPGTTDDEPIR